MSEIEMDQGEGIDVTDVKDGGVIKVITKQGTGTESPCEGCNVAVHYVGKFLDGTQFDSSRNTGRPLDFTLGKGYVIAGWELALETMKKGEICTLTCQPEYAYGKTGRPPVIPENTTLVFEIELLYWIDQLVTLDALVTKKIVKKGKGTDYVSDGGTVNVHIIGKDGERVFDERDVKFVVGEGMQADVITGIDVAIRTMKRGEVALVTCDSSYGFGETGHAEWNIAPGASVTYKVHLKSSEQLKPPWELSGEERIESAKIAKEKGTEYFKQERYSLALTKFTRLVALVESLTVTDELQQVAPMILAGHLNVALCYLKLGKYFECMDSCDKALFNDKDNVKALYRKARAQLALNNLEESKDLLQHVLRLDSMNKDARNYLTIVKKKLDEHRQKEKKVFENMFEKFATQDAKSDAIAAQDLEMKNKLDVFDKAKEEAKITYGEETASNSDAKSKLDSKDGNTASLENGDKLEATGASQATNTEDTESNT